MAERTPMVKVSGYWQELPAGDTVAGGGGSSGWTVVESASATVSPTAADSGKYYRLSHAAPTFELPTTSLVIGETHFWLTYTGATWAGHVEAGTGKTCDHFVIDSGTFNAGQADQTIYNCCGFRLYHIRYVATNTWASDIFNST